MRNLFPKNSQNSKLKPEMMT